MQHGFLALIRNISFKVRLAAICRFLHNSIHLSLVKERMLEMELMLDMVAELDYCEDLDADPESGS